MQRGLKVIALQGAVEKSPILLSQYWKFEWLDGTIIILYFGGSNTIFADCTPLTYVLVDNFHPCVQKYPFFMWSKIMHS